MPPRHAFSATRLLHALALCVTLLAAGQVAAAPLKVVGRFLQDTHGNNILMRGVNLPVYKSGYADDLDVVAAAIARTKANAVRLEWWAVPPGIPPNQTTQYTLTNFDRAIQKFYDLGIIPVVELHDLTFVFGQNDPPGGANSSGNDRALFANTITAFWTRADVVTILKKHQDHIVINLANEWGTSFYSDATPTTTNFIQNYTVAITAMRNAGIIAPLMVDAPKGFEYQFLLDNGQALLAADPQQNTLLSTHAYWAASDSAFTIAGVNAILDNFKNSGLPVVLGEASSNAYTNVPCDPINYPNLLTRANTNAIGYLFWAWYEDGQCGQLMNITVGPPPNGGGVTLPTAANPGFGYNALYAAGYGIDAALPTTSKADFSPVGAPALLNTSFNYNVTSTNDNVIRSATAQVTKLNNFGAAKRPVVVLMPGWGGVGDVAAVWDAQTLMFANQGYVALNIGFHQTSNMPAGALTAYYSDLAESAKTALDLLCVQTDADCSAVVIVGESYGGTQIHPVVRYLRIGGAYDGSNAARKVVAMLGQDSGYTYYYDFATRDANATQYSIAMIQNLGDMDFPVDSCQFDNCGARNRADYHQTAVGSQYVLSYCPAGGAHGSRGYADWDAWVLSAVKTMLHNQRGVPKFTGYVEPTFAVSNACLTTPAAVIPDAPVIGTATAANAQATVTFTAPASNGGSAITGYTVISNPPGGVDSTAGTTGLSHIVTGLTNGTPYTFVVRATNVIGPSAPSAASNSVTPATVPGAPTIANATAGNALVTVAFSSPASNGGSPITNYTATCGAQNATSSSLVITVSGLTNGTAVTCTVTAANSIGSSVPSSPSNSVTPRALNLLRVLSRKAHGAMGSFDLRIDTTKLITDAVTVEPRAIGSGHVLVFQFDNAVNTVGTLSVADGTNAVVSAYAIASLNDVIVTIPTLADNKRVSVSLVGVNGSVNLPPVSLGCLVGDVNNSRSVNASDISAVKAGVAQAQPVTAANFQYDLNTDGSIAPADISAVKGRAGQVLQ